MPRGANFARRTVRDGKGLAAAIGRIQRKAAPNRPKLRRGLKRVAKEVREVIAMEAVRRAGIPRGTARRRIKISAPRRYMLVSLSTQPDSGVIHAGRVKGIRQRKGRVRRVPGVTLPPGAFLFRPALYRGQERRVYVKKGGHIVPILHGLTYKELYDGKGRRVALVLLRRMFRQNRDEQRSRARDMFGHTGARLGDVVLRV